MGTSETVSRRRPGGGPSFGAPAPWAHAESQGHLLTADDRAMLAGIATIFRFKKGERIYEEGDNANFVFNLISGMVSSYRSLRNGGRHIAGFLLPGDLLGLSEHGKYVNSAEAVTAVTLYRLPSPAVEASLRRHPGIDFPVICKLCHDLREAQNHALLLSKHRAVAKLGRFLQMLEIQQAGLGVGTDEVFLQMSRLDIASYLGISAEAVSRSMRELAARGVIGFRDRRHARIIDRAALEAIVWELDTTADA